MPERALPPSDEVLFLEFQRGSRDAFGELYRRYRGPMQGFFRRRLSSAARAEELAQDIFLAVIHGKERYEPRASVRTYLFAIAMNLLRSERRRAGRESGAELPEKVVAPSPETGCWVRAALSSLDLADREIVMLREYEQLTYEEIGALLHVPLNTVRSRLFRARQELKRLLETPLPVNRAREA